MADTTLAPTAPDSAPDTSFDAAEDAIQATLRDTFGAPGTDAPVAEAPAEASGLSQDAQGRWHNADGTFVSAEEAATQGALAATAPASAGTPAEALAAVADEPAAAPTLPDGVVMPAALARTLETEFSIRAPDGTELAAPDVTITFKANGRDRTEPLDKVVKLAQMGYYSHEREQQMLTTQRDSETVRAEAEQIRTYAQQLEQRYLAVLSDDAAYLADREAMLAEQSPERQLAREREAIAAERAALAQAGVQRQAESFVNGELATAIDAIAQHHDFVSPEEVAAKLSTDLHLFMRNGIVPPEQYEAVRRHVVQAVLPWVRETQHARAERFAPRQRQAAADVEAAKAATAKAEADKVRAQVEAQKAKRNTARAAAPVGRVAASAAPPQARPINTARDAFEDAVTSSLHATLGAPA